MYECMQIRKFFNKIVITIKCFSQLAMASLQIAINYIIKVIQLTVFVKLIVKAVHTGARP